MFTMFARIYVGVLMALSYAALWSIGGFAHPFEFLVGGFVAAFYLALPVLIVTALGWVVCGGLKK